MSRFEEFQEQRGYLFAIAYRMLGSAADAEDILQEAFVRWSESGARVDNPRAYLATVVTRLCIRHRHEAASERRRYPGPWLPEPVATPEPATAELDESLSVAFLYLLECLTARERAVFLLRDVFAFSYPEIARILRTSEANCRQLARRARLLLSSRRPRFRTSSHEAAELVRAFARAAGEGDLDALVNLLAEDAAVTTDGGGKARAVPRPVLGAKRVAAFVHGAVQKFLPPDCAVEIASVNGTPGIVTRSAGRCVAVISFEISAGRIQSVYVVTNPDKLRAVEPVSPFPDRSTRLGPGAGRKD